jgi:hypothetical protein
LITRFLRTFGIYPPGTTVELTDRQAALVTHASPHDPVRPQVQLLTGEQAGRQVDLRHRNVIEGRHELSIARAILPPLALREPQARWVVEPAGPPAEQPAEEELEAATETTTEALAAEPPAPVEPPPTPAPAEPPAPTPAPAPEDEDEEQVLARLGGGDAVPTLALGEAELREAALDHRAGFVLTFVDGMCPLDSLLYSTGLPRAEVLRILDRLVRAGVIRTK